MCPGHLVITGDVPEHFKCLYGEPEHLEIESRTLKLDSH